MNSIKFVLVAFVGRTLASLDFVYDLQQDEELGTYYLETFVGMLQERALLLIDTMANGTAIKYPAEQSRRAVIHDDMQDIVTLS